MVGGLRSGGEAGGLFPLRERPLKRPEWRDAFRFLWSLSSLPEWYGTRFDLLIRAPSLLNTVGPLRITIWARLFK